MRWGRPSPRLGDMRPGRRSQLRFLCDHGKATEGLGRDRRLHSPVDTCLLGSRPFEARGRRAGELGWEGRLTPKCPKCCQSVQSVVPSPFKTEGPSGEGGAGQSEQRGGLGTLPSPDQVAVACWPEIPSSLAAQVLDPLSLALRAAQVPSFQEARGRPFPWRLTRNLACPSVPEELGPGVPEPRRC